MSVLRLKCLDQVLTVTNAPVIASGGIDENTLEVEFCSEWDGFAKTAVFYKLSNQEEVYNVLMVDDKCTIPHEVTDTDGKVFIGIFGVYGETRRTAKPIIYKIVEGSFIEGYAPQEPTPDIYTQIMNVHSDILAKTDRVFDVMKDVVRLKAADYYALEVKDPDVFYVIEDLEYTPYQVIEAYLDSDGNVTTDFDITTIAINNVYQFVVKLWLTSSKDRFVWLPFSYIDGQALTGTNFHFINSVYHVYINRSLTSVWSIYYIYGKFNGNSKTTDKLNVQDISVVSGTYFSGYDNYFPITKKGLYACVVYDSSNDNYYTSMLSIYDLTKEFYVKAENYILKMLITDSVKGIVCTTPGRLINCKLITEY